MKDLAILFCILALAVGVLTSACHMAAGQADHSGDDEAAAPKAQTQTPTLDLQDGDIVFQDSSPHSGQAEAIKALTRSKWSHCGIYFTSSKTGGVVIDGNGRGKVMGWADWKAGGKDGEVAIYRFKKGMTAEQVVMLRDAANKLDQRPYDLKFAWDDESIYCSELIWKACQRALQIELGDLQKLDDFDLQSDLARPLIERPGSWGSLENVRENGDEEVISPQAIADCEHLTKVEV
jgi:uncharacterized protein YycO